MAKTIQQRYRFFVSEDGIVFFETRYYADKYIKDVLRFNYPPDVQYDISAEEYGFRIWLVSPFKIKQNKDFVCI